MAVFGNSSHLICRISIRVHQSCFFPIMAGVCFDRYSNNSLLTQIGIVLTLLFYGSCYSVFKGERGEEMTIFSATVYYSF